MGVPRIPGANNGEGHTPWVWHASNKSDNLRYGALVAVSLLSQADPLDIVLPFEVQGGSLVAGDIIGVNTKAGPENTLTTPLSKDDVGVHNISVASGIGRAEFILSQNQTITAANPFLIPDPAVPGNVIAMPAGSAVPPVARALTYMSTTSSEKLIEAEFMPGLSVGLTANPGQLVLGDAIDAVVTARYIPTSGNHVNPAAPDNTPVLYRARVPTRIFLPQADVAVAPGAGNGVRYQFKIGSTPALANAASPVTYIDILDANTSGTPAGGAGTPTAFTMPAGTVLVVSTLAQAGGVGAAVHSMISLRAQ